ncbi:Y-family DNA polymerase [Sphingomonas phyllosphaerae]|uniref:Y-family DNA polymerase n=1 Tax=Sphingomonas phyllosphaerae TaxID=257003 RepID=UPI00048BC3AE|nr:DNA polymerase Y family protein [Sphingomonas phyllosphaerae]
MKRVASLYLPSWSIDRLRRIERRAARSAEADGRAAFDALGTDAAAERAQHCSVPRGGGWRPGARWARTDPGSGLADTRDQVESAVAGLPAHRRPAQRELGRTSEAAATPFRELSRRTEAAEPLFRPGTRGWSNEDLQASVEALPAHRRPSLQELSRKTELVDHPFRPLPPDEAGALRRMGRMPPVLGPGEDVVVRRAMKAPRRSARDGHGGEAGHVAPPNLAQSLKQLAAMPAVQFPGEGPHPDNHGKSAPTAPGYGHGRFFQTGRTLATMVARVCDDADEDARAAAPVDEQPLVTVQRSGARVEVAAANDAARALGIDPGTALTMARAQVPGLDVREAEPDRDAADLAALATLLARRWAPTVTVSDADGLFVDLTGVAHLHGGEARFCRRLLRLLARYGIAARVAVADTPGAAWALARFGARDAVQIVAPGGQGKALAQLPVAALRLDAPALELLARLGIEAIGQLTALPRAPLVRRFGRAIADRIDQALGQLPEPFEPIVPPTRVAVEQRFVEPIATPEAIEHWLRELMQRLAVALAKAGQGARAVEMIAARVDGVPQILRLGFARPTRDAAHMLRLTLRRIEEIEPGYGIDGIALIVRRADPLGAETLAPALADDAAPDLAPLIDALINRIGAGRLWRVAPVESDVPERSWTRTAPLDPPQRETQKLRPDDVRQLDARSPDHPWHPRWPRPVLLLRRPERIDHVLAELPDQPPKRFTWRGTMHLIVRAEGPERVAGEWWRRAPERMAVRDYYRVEDETGQRFWLFRRGDGMRSETGDLSWFLHGLGN